jgi:hypothetical protein
VAAAEGDVVAAPVVDVGDGAVGGDAGGAGVRVAAAGDGGGLGAGCVGGGGGAAVEGAVGAAVVVLVGEPAELVLEGGQGLGGGLAGEPAFEGLVEPLDLALGLGVARLAVLLGDPAGGELGLEGVAAAGGQAGGEDQAVEFLSGVKRSGWS